MTNQDIMDMVPQSTSFTSASTSTTAEEDSFPEQTQAVSGFTNHSTPATIGDF